MSFVSIDNYQFLTTEEAARFLTLSPETLRTWRSRGKGPDYVRLNSKSIRYRIKDLKKWVDASSINSGRGGVLR